MLNIKKNLTLLHPKNAAFFYLVHLFSSSSSSASASKTLDSCHKSNPIAEYLINSCGLSSQKAASASKLLSKWTSIDQAHRVRHFFKLHGFTDTHVRKLISNYPWILSVNIEKTLEPNLQTLNEMGFIEEELQRLIASNPSLLVNPLAIPRLEFWQTFLRTKSRKDLVSVFWRNPGLIGQDIVSGIAPKIALLKEHGLSESDIAGLVKRGHGFIKRSTKAIEALLKSATELGFDPKSSMFGVALSSLSGLSRGALEDKMEFFKGLGWSEEDLLTAVKKVPFVIRFSKEILLEKMDFLVGAGCTLSYIASRPYILLFSLEKRLKPRHHVIEMLKSNEINTRWGLFSTMSIPEKKFVETFILPYKEQVPKLHDIYITACAGQTPT